jgi:nitroimidazol reductase NimA-like FMN-containing flavoprotein (pyridoxamine 5'-phosphate oxidase superfamily)
MAADPRIAMRRSDRAMPDDAAIEALLARAPFGVTATSIDDQPFLHTSLYWYDAPARRVYFHTAATGRTLENIRRNPKVCFSVAEIGRLLPGNTAMQFSNEYASVIAFGRAHMLDDMAQKRHGLQGLLDKYFSDLQAGRDYRPITDDELGVTAVFVIDIESWSGKQKKAEG